MDYEKTPSFYNNREYFEKYLGRTSYYTALQAVVRKIIVLSDPKNVLELGSALGTTTLWLAEQFPEVRFDGLDIREDVVAKANQASSNISNAGFFSGDMCDFVCRQSLRQYDLIFLLYSFHHITDPLERKERFLQNCYQNMHEGSYLLIEETFLPEDSKNLTDAEAIHRQFEKRALEGYASTFWASLCGLNEDQVNLAKCVGSFSKSEESKAGEHVIKRDEEFLVKFSWLKKVASDIGFAIIFVEPVNCIDEKAILLRR